MGFQKSTNAKHKIILNLPPLDPSSVENSTFCWTLLSLSNLPFDEGWLDLKLYLSGVILGMNVRIFPNQT